jgi:peptidyl-prolyl cis-trans isomerase-like 4
MSLLLETTLGDLVIDLDIEGSPELCKNILKLAKARYYTSSLIYNVQPNRFFQWGDPKGDGSGGACIYGLLDATTKINNQKDVTQSKYRFLKSSMGRILTNSECQEKGRVVATEIDGIADTLGSQLLITIDQGQDKALDGFQTLGEAGNDPSTAGNNAGGDNSNRFRSVGRVVEDDNHVLDRIATTYCDASGRPYADIRIIRALVVDDPFDDLPGMDQLLKDRGVVFGDNNADTDKIIASPEYERPPEETVEIRIQADQIDPEADEEDVEKLRQREEQLLQREDQSRSVVLEMLGDLPSADIKAPENVLFVCKLNPVTEDDDLELIFSRFDEKVKVEIIRDHETGSSLQYAFVEFTSKEQAAEAYFKMNNALVDDRRIKVDFSQSVAKVWDRFNQRQRGTGNNKNYRMPRDPFTGDVRRGGNGDRGGGRPEHDDQFSQKNRVNRVDRYNDRFRKGSDQKYSEGQHEHQYWRNESPRHHQQKQKNRKSPQDHHRREEHNRDDYDDYRHHHRHNSKRDGRSAQERHRHDDDTENNERKKRWRSPNNGDDRDEYGRSVRRRRSPSPRDGRKFDNKEDDNSSESDNSLQSRDNRRHRSRSPSHDSKERRHHKRKRKRHRREESRERKHKKHRKHRREEKKLKSKHVKS